MLEEAGFDQWAGAYDACTGALDREDAYPFAGYGRVLAAIEGAVLAQGARTVLDLGFGTGVLTARLYQKGCRIYGQDFSPKMAALAREKMPEAELYHGDLSQGLVEQLKGRRYDAVIATYSLHHLTDPGKLALIRELLPLLSPGGRVYIGDVAFETREALLACRQQCGECWDGDEIYFVWEELRPLLPNSTFTPYSHCAGVLAIWP